MKPDSDLGRLFTHAGCANLLDLSSISKMFDLGIDASKPELLQKFLGPGELLKEVREE